MRGRFSGSCDREARGSLGSGAKPLMGPRSPKGTQRAETPGNGHLALPGLPNGSLAPFSLRPEQVTARLIRVFVLRARGRALLERFLVGGEAVVPLAVDPAPAREL